MNYIIQRFSWNELSPVWKHKSKSDDAAKYYSQITAGQLKKLYKLYEPDFLLFNYTMHPYDTYVQKEGK